MFKKYSQLSFLIIFLSTQLTYNMDQAPLNKPQTLGQKLTALTLSARECKRQQAALAAQQPKTLYEYFGMTQLASASRDVKALVAKALIGNGGWWWLKRQRIYDDLSGKIAFSADGRLFAIVHYNVVDICNLTCNESDIIYLTHKEPVTAFAFHPTSRSIATIESNICTMWHCTGKLISTFNTAWQHSSHIAFHPTKNIIAIATACTVYLYDYTGKRMRKIKHTTYVQGIDFNEDGVLGTTPWVGESRLWNDEGKQIQALPHRGFNSAIALHPNNNIIATAELNRVLLWNMQGEQTCTLLHNGRINRVKFNSQKMHVGTASSDKTACLWNFRGTKLRTFYHLNPVRGIAFHPCGTLFATAATKNTVCLWQQHEQPTLEQVLLRQLIKNWVLTCIAQRKKPHFPCTSAAEVPTWMAVQFNIQKDELERIWQSMNERLQNAIAYTLKGRAHQISALCKLYEDQDTKRQIMKPYNPTEPVPLETLDL
ncbi:MAG: WD40 repeat domain-containing protein [Candidatus Babeliales bacterium]